MNHFHSKPRVFRLKFIAGAIAGTKRSCTWFLRNRRWAGVGLLWSRGLRSSGSMQHDIRGYPRPRLGWTSKELGNARKAIKERKAPICIPRIVSRGLGTSEKELKANGNRTRLWFPQSQLTCLRAVAKFLSNRIWSRKDFAGTTDLSARFSVCRFDGKVYCRYVEEVIFHRSRLIINRIYTIILSVCRSIKTESCMPWPAQVGSSLAWKQVLQAEVTRRRREDFSPCWSPTEGNQQSTFPGSHSLYPHS